MFLMTRDSALYKRSSPSQIFLYSHKEPVTPFHYTFTVNQRNLIINSKMPLSKCVKLNNGNSMPLIGLGTFASKTGGECRDAVKTAILNGYRWDHFLMLLIN